MMNKNRLWWRVLVIRDHFLESLDLFRISLSTLERRTTTPWSKPGVHQAILGSNRTNSVTQGHREERATPPHIIACGVSDVRLSLAHPAFRGKGKSVFSLSSAFTSPRPRNRCLFLISYRASSVASLQHVISLRPHAVPEERAGLSEGPQTPRTADKTLFMHGLKIPPPLC